nr:hypothetical protein [Candidatus Sigynarchaeota archaeon]
MMSFAVRSLELTKKRKFFKVSLNSKPEVAQMPFSRKLFQEYVVVVPPFFFKIMSKPLEIVAGIHSAGFNVKQGFVPGINGTSRDLTSGHGL